MTNYDLFSSLAASAPQVARSALVRLARRRPQMRIFTFILLGLGLATATACVLAGETADTPLNQNPQIFDIPSQLVSYPHHPSPEQLALAKALIARGATQAVQLNKYLQDVTVNRPEAFSAQEVDSAMDGLPEVVYQLAEGKSALGSAAAAKGPANPSCLVVSGHAGRRRFNDGCGDHPLG